MHTLMKQHLGRLSPCHGLLAARPPSTAVMKSSNKDSLGILAWQWTDTLLRRGGTCRLLPKALMI